MLWGRGNGASGMALVAGVGLAVRVLPGDWASGLGSAERRQNGKAVWSERVGLLVAGLRAEFRGKSRRGATNSGVFCGQQTQHWWRARPASGRRRRIWICI
jgi:hypothetical protein